ncbi:type II toxin-antitoxin system YhaV family toxin [Terriglobus sp.]|uniref:type II toxin-antitoxin system YhaV family toxin n=1 Tax=Terriglobus sp. TaxID=1889013 RepID=UPI003B0098E9
MTVNGWRLYAHPLFQQQLEKLTVHVETLARKNPVGYREAPATKLLATIERHIHQIIPRDPGAAAFRQGNTLGPDNRHWFRAKFHERYRLFFRFSTEQKVIVYAWVNDEQTLHKSGSKTDPYQVFRAMLESGDPPQSFQQLQEKAKAVGEHRRATVTTPKSPDPVRKAKRGKTHGPNRTR